MLRRALPLLLTFGCGESPSRVQLVPIDLGTSCGRPEAGQIAAIRVIAYTRTGELRRADAEIADFPADTEQLGVEILGGGGPDGVLATGKTAPLAYGDLADRATIPIAMLPPSGFCRVHAMATPRAHPVVARAGQGVLVLGGAAVADAEYYDPTTATFTPVALPSVLGDDPSAIAGAAATTLPDGRVVVTGGQALTVFDPSTMAFSSPALISRRIEHTAFAIDERHVLLTGGCLSTGTSCDGGATPLRSSLEYEIDASGRVIGDGRARPALPATSTHYRSRGVDGGVGADGLRRLVLAGSTAAATTADRIVLDPQGGTVVTVQATHAQAAALDGGAVLTAFDPDGTAPPSGAASIIPADTGDAVPAAIGPAVDGARLVTAEDGSVFAIGGDAAIARYVPTTNTWIATTPNGDPLGAVKAPSLIRLDDGTVLVVGGTLGGVPTADAWLFRPSLVGARAGQVVAFPDGSGAIVTTPNPQVAQRSAGRLALVGPSGGVDDITALAMVGGPRLATGTMTANVRVTAAGGVALVAQQTSSGRALVAHLVIGQPARVERRTGATTVILCTGSTITADDLALPLQLVVTDDRVTASIGNAPTTAKVSCDVASDIAPAERGSWGIAATAGSVVEIAAITVSR